MIYSKPWVRNTVYLIAITPTIYLYAAFFLAFSILDKYKKEKAKDSWMKMPLEVIVFPVGIIFLFMDGEYDLTIGSILFRKFAEWDDRDKTFTARIKMYLEDYETMLEDPSLYDEDIVARYEQAVKFRDLILKVDPNHF